MFPYPESVITVLLVPVAVLGGAQGAQAPPPPRSEALLYSAKYVKDLRISIYLC